MAPEHHPFSPFNSSGTEPPRRYLKGERCEDVRSSRGNHHTLAESVLQRVVRWSTTYWCRRAVIAAQDTMKGRR